MNNIYVVAYNWEEYYRWFIENSEAVSKLKNCKFEYGSNHYKILGDRECFMCFNERSHLRDDIQSFYGLLSLNNQYPTAIEMDKVQKILSGSLEQMLVYMINPEYKDYLFLIEDRLNDENKM